MMCEEAPHRLNKAVALTHEDNTALQKRHDVFLRDAVGAHTTPCTSGDYTASRLTSSLITVDEANDLLDFSNLAALPSNKFQTVGIPDDSEPVPEDNRLNPDFWRVASIDFDLGTYGVVFPDIPLPIVLEKDELICRLKAPSNFFPYLALL
jgi:hypothetical protein